MLDFSLNTSTFIFTQSTLGRVLQYNLRTLNLPLILYLTICSDHVAYTHLHYRTYKCQHLLRRSNVRIIAHLLVFKSIQYKTRNKTLKLRTPKTFRSLKLPKSPVKHVRLQKLLRDSRVERMTPIDFCLNKNPHHCRAPQLSNL